MSTSSLPNPDVVDVSVHIIEPPKQWVPLNIKELWQYRELSFFLVFRDLKIRYKQTVLGILWAIIQPFITMIVFSFVFGRVARIPSDGIPYPLFIYVGMLPWTFFSNGLSKASNSLNSNASLIKKIYFPRLVLPIVSILSGLIDFVLGSVMLLVLYAYFAIATPGMPLMFAANAFPLANNSMVTQAFQSSLRNYEITGNIIWLPLLLLLTFIVALSLSLWFAALNVRFRDVGYGLSFLVRILLYLTPIIYPISRLDGVARTIAALNPLTGVVEGFRWALLGVDSAPGPYMLVSAVMSVILLIGGLYFFRRAESSFADLL